MEDLERPEKTLHLGRENLGVCSHGAGFKFLNDPTRSPDHLTTGPGLLPRVLLFDPGPGRTSPASSRQGFSFSGEVGPENPEPFPSKGFSFPRGAGAGGATSSFLHMLSSPLAEHSGLRPARPADPKPATRISPGPQRITRRIMNIPGGHGRDCLDEPIPW